MGMTIVQQLFSNVIIWISSTVSLNVIETTEATQFSSVNLEKLARQLTESYQILSF